MQISALSSLNSDLQTNTASSRKRGEKGTRKALTSSSHLGNSEIESGVSFSSGKTGTTSEALLFSENSRTDLQRGVGKTDKTPHELEREIKYSKQCGKEKITTVTFRDEDEKGRASLAFRAVEDFSRPVVETLQKKLGEEAFCAEIHYYLQLFIGHLPREEGSRRGGSRVVGSCLPPVSRTEFTAALGNFITNAQTPKQMARNHKEDAEQRSNNEDSLHAVDSSLFKNWYYPPIPRDKNAIITLMARLSFSSILGALGVEKERFDRNNWQKFRKVKLPNVFRIEDAACFSLPNSLFQEKGLEQCESLHIKNTAFLLLPSEIEMFCNLKKLIIENSILRTFPAAISGLKALEKLVIGSTYLERLPEELWALRVLSYLEIDETHKEGSKVCNIPDSIVGLIRLNTLILKNFSGEVSSKVGEHPTLRHIHYHPMDAKHCNDFLSKLSQLKHRNCTVETLCLDQIEDLRLLPLPFFHLSFLSILGSTITISSKRKHVWGYPLEHLDLSGSKIYKEARGVRTRKDRLPGDIGQLAQLRVLNISNMELQFLPQFLKKMGKLRQIIAQGKSFSGGLPNLKKTALKQLDIRGLNIKQGFSSLQKQVPKNCTILHEDWKGRALNPGRHRRGRPFIKPSSRENPSAPPTKTGDKTTSKTPKSRSFRKEASSFVSKPFPGGPAYAESAPSLGQNKSRKVRISQVVRWFMEQKDSRNEKTTGIST